MTLFKCIYSSADQLILSPEELDVLQETVFRNECSGQVSKLIEWSKGEEFPSLGIGHFIWYPAGFNGPYEESFPKLLLLAEANGVEIPSWIRELPDGRHCPWASREEFMQDLGGARIASLRKFLEETMPLQTIFIAGRVESLLPKLLDKTPPNLRPALSLKFNLLMGSQAGRLALVDYVNFKGEGLSGTERYKGQGWGLFQVLEEMNVSKSASDPLKEFVRAAEKVLIRRVENSVPERNESQWLPGWENRLRGYLT
jgi:hypothetical protein